MDGSNSVPNLRDAAHARCADCHQDFYDKGLKGCRSCHVREKSKQNNAHQQCSDCHNVPTDQLIPNTMNAFHEQCRSCHKNKNRGPFNDESCKQCHMQ